MFKMFALHEAKCSYFNNEIIDCGNDFKAMFSIMGDSLHSKKPTKLLDHDSSANLADQFADYYTSKIVNN